jgi:hypothetical protein
LAAALEAAGDERFAMPDSLARLLVGNAYLGQLDVNPLGGPPGQGRSDRASWRFFGQREPAQGDPRRTRVWLQGESDVSGATAGRDGFERTGMLWEHTVRLTWEGCIELEQGRMTRLAMVAAGSERLRWGNWLALAAGDNDVSRLPAGHPIDLDCGVRYGLTAATLADRPPPAAP